MDTNLAPLVERIRQGDVTALCDFIEGRRPQLLAFVAKNLGAALASKIEPDDILQESTVDALRRIAELATNDRDPFGWLCQIAEHRLIDAHRRYFGAQKRAAGREVGLNTPSDDTRQSPLVNLLVASMTSPSQAFSRNQKEIQLLEAMATLPADSREALRLRYVDGLATRDIADRLGKSDGAIRVLLTRSLNKLQELLGVSE